jgi:hypothetical protein
MAETAAMSHIWLKAYFLVNTLLWTGIWAVNHFHGPTWLQWTLILTGLVLTLARGAKENGWFKSSPCELIPLPASGDDNLVNSGLLVTFLKGHVFSKLLRHPIDGGQVT